MKMILQWLVAGVLIVGLSGCGGAPTETKKDNTGKTDTQSNSDEDKSTYLQAGTADAPTQLQLGEPYATTDLFNTYVKFKVHQFHRIVFATTDPSGDRDFCANDFKLLDADMNNFKHFAAGDTWDSYTVRDYILLKEGTYIVEFPKRDNCIIVAQNLGITQLPKVQNKGTYSGDSYDDDHKYYDLEMKKDGDVNFKGDLDTYGNLRAFSAVLYDYDFNIIENFDSVRDINVTLPQGNYLYHPTDDAGTITFLNQ